jgi:hypothetical protein
LRTGPGHIKVAVEPLYLCLVVPVRGLGNGKEE